MVDGGEYVNGHAFPSFEGKAFEPDEGWALTDEIDHQILMHRDAHFGGDFEVMIAYYEDEDHIGIYPDFDLERMIYLAQVEKEMGQDLAPLILTGKEAEEVAKARYAYAKLKEVYEEENPDFPARLLADLILSEEEEPVKEIEAIVAKGKYFVSELLALVKEEDAYSPLFPGYGYAPYLAILCLGEIKDPAAVIPLFETLACDMVFDEWVVLEALVKLGDPARDFLLRRVQGRPLTQDNMHAAFALTGFAGDEKVAQGAFQELGDPLVREHPLLRTYLVTCCEGLKNTPLAKEFALFVQDPTLPEELKTQIEQVVADW